MQLQPSVVARARSHHRRTGVAATTAAAVTTAAAITAAAITAAAAAVAPAGFDDRRCGGEGQDVLAELTRPMAVGRGMPG